MQLLSLLSPPLCLLLSTTITHIDARRSLAHVGRGDKISPMMQKRQEFISTYDFSKKSKRAESPESYRFLNNVTQQHAVDGAKIPNVSFDVGPSFAGLLPISANASEENQLYYWFWPSDNPDSKDEILIWLNGGPGCSSLEGMLQENGPFLWQYGTFKPVSNPYTWVNLTNVVWVEQPVGTGFSQGSSRATSETEVARQFLGFFKNFVNLYSMQGYKVYIAGESYAGYYVPYIADAMLNANDTTYYNFQASMIYDPSVTYNAVAMQTPVWAFVESFPNLFPFNDTFKATMRNASQSCGYTAFMDKYLQFPPPGPMPGPKALPGTINGNTKDECDIFEAVIQAISLINPCFDIYQVATTCPVLWDVLGFPGSFQYKPAGADIYFNRTDVQKAINAPNQPWVECVSDVLTRDTSPPSGVSVLPSVIERSKRTIIAHGALDFVLLANGTLLMIQNMTWGGKQGFQNKPKDPFFVPYHNDMQAGTLAGAGVMGTTHTERGLTWVVVEMSGHMVGGCKLFFLSLLSFSLSLIPHTFPFNPSSHIRTLSIHPSIHLRH